MFTENKICRATKGNTIIKSLCGNLSFRSQTDYSAVCGYRLLLYFDLSENVMELLNMYHSIGLKFVHVVINIPFYRLVLIIVVQVSQCEGFGFASTRVSQQAGFEPWSGGSKSRARQNHSATK